MFNSYKLHHLISPSNDSSEKNPKPKKQVILKGIEDIQYCPLDTKKKKKQHDVQFFKMDTETLEKPYRKFVI